MGGGARGCGVFGVQALLCCARRWMAAGAAQPMRFGTHKPACLAGTHAHRGLSHISRTPNPMDTTDEGHPRPPGSPSPANGPSAPDRQHPHLALEPWWQRHQRAVGRVTPVDPTALLDLTNADAVGPAMTLNNTLLLVACSATKRDCVPPGGLPLIELYNGSIWQTVRHHLVNWSLAGARLVVLSGRFGITSGGRYAYPYDARLSREKADALIRNGLLAPQDDFGELRRAYAQGLLAPAPLMHLLRPGSNPDEPDTGWAGVVICGGTEYRRVFMALLHQLSAWGGLAPDAAVLTAHGGLGEQRQQLGRWLDHPVDRSPGLRARLVASQRTSLAA